MKYLISIFFYAVYSGSGVPEYSVYASDLYCSRTFRVWL